MRRTTVVLDDEVLERLRAESQIRKATFRKTLNDAIRDGLTFAEQRRESKTVFRVTPYAMGLKQGLSYDSTSALIEFGEATDLPNY